MVLYHQFQFYCYFRALSGLRTWATGIVFTAGGDDDDDHGDDGALCVHQAATPTVQVFRKRLEEGFLRTISSVHTCLLTFLECPRVRFSSFAHFMKLFQ